MTTRQDGRSGALHLAIAVVVGSVLAAGAWPACADTVPASQIRPPSVVFGQLYQAVEEQGLFVDSKSFADALPDAAPSRIMADYAREKKRPGFSLVSFVAGHFRVPERRRVAYGGRPDRAVQSYISATWDALERQPDDVSPYSSLLPLPYPYVVPGGRFTEIYYWDSYFSMLGLEQDGRDELAHDMIRNMASLIDRYGHVPNGNRTYYLSRSEPPFFACMIDLIAAHDGQQAYLTYLPELQREYNYWMDGAASLEPGHAYRHLVRLDDGVLLNRYWDDRDTPRDEAYRQDVATAGSTTRPAAQVYRELRAGGETGWDFSSRWLADGIHLNTIRTTEMLPVDLNSLVAHMEQTLSLAYGLRGDAVRARMYRTRVLARTEAIQRLMWQPDLAAFTDYVWTEHKPGRLVSAATVLPLFFQFVSDDQARAVAATIRTRLLGPGGMATTAIDTGQQWDSPNGWAPMQWMAVIGLRGYGQDDLAQTIAQRWIERELAAYAKSGVLLEKYDVEASGNAVAAGAAGGYGGEYPLQVGFGWTNGVLAGLMHLYPVRTAVSMMRHPEAIAH